MSSIGSHPGAILFRLGAMVILIAILMAVFFDYLEDTEKQVEEVSILQTKRVIDSSLALFFARLAVSGSLDRLGEIDGGNPFVFLRPVEILPASYRGEIESEPGDESSPGWYYLKHRGVLAYKSRYLGSNRYYRVRLGYRDVNHSGRFEYGVDHFENLSFVKIEG